MTKVWLVKMLELPDCNFSTVLKVFSSEKAAKTYVESVENEFWGNLCITEHTVEDMPAGALKPCPFCGSPVHWNDGIIHDEIRFNCIVDMVWPLEANMHIPKEMWIKKWNTRVRE